MPNIVDVIDRDLGDGVQNYQISWADDDDWNNGDVVILCKDDEGDEAKMILSQDELLQLITDAASFRRALRK